MDQQIMKFETLQLPTQSLPQFPFHPSHPYNHTFSLPINQYISHFHNQQLIQLEDQIQFIQAEDCLKRFYHVHEWNMKIKLLGEYYRYHHEIPHFFLEKIGRIVDQNIEQKRALQFDHVSKQNQYASTYRSNPKSSRQKPQNKMLEDIELSYQNFENKQPKKGYDSEKQTQKRGMKRVISVQGKGLLGDYQPKDGHFICGVNPKANKYKKPVKHNQQKVKKIQEKKIYPQSQKVSSNNSLASQKNMSRSKSKTNLHVVEARKFTTSSITKSKGNVLSLHSSNQNSLMKGKQPTTASLCKKNTVNLVKTSSKKNFKPVQKKVQKGEKVIKAKTVNKQNQNRLKSASISNLKKNVNMKGQQAKGMFKKIIQNRKRFI